MFDHPGWHGADAIAEIVASRRPVQFDCRSFVQSYDATIYKRKTLPEQNDYLT